MDGRGSRSARRPALAVVIAALSLGLFVGCGSDAGSDAADEQSPASTAGLEFSYSCAPKGPSDLASGTVCVPQLTNSELDQLAPEERPTEHVFESDKLKQFSADDFRRLRETLDSGQFIPVADEDSLRQLKQWADDNAVSPSLIEDIYQPATNPTRCRVQRAPFIKIRVLVCS